MKEQATGEPFGLHSAQATGAHLGVQLTHHIPERDPHVVSLWRAAAPTVRHLAAADPANRITNACTPDPPRLR